MAEKSKERGKVVAFPTNYWPVIEKTLIRIQKYYSLKTVMPGSREIFVDSVSALERSLKPYMDKRYKTDLAKETKQIHKKRAESKRKFTDDDRADYLFGLNFKESEIKWGLLMDLMGRKT